MTAPDIVLLVFDTLRTDILSSYGGAAATPAIDAFADDGIKFVNAYAPGPTTAVSHPALFTGQYPSCNGVMRNSEHYTDITGPVLPEYLSQHGYVTFGIAGPAQISSDFGFDRGFHEYFESWYDMPGYTSPQYPIECIRNAKLRRPLAKNWLQYFWRGPDDLTSFKFALLREQLSRGDSPQFLFANVTTAHTPYDPPRPYKEEATPELERSRWFFYQHLRGIEESIDRVDVRASRVYEAQTTSGLAKYRADPSWLNESELEVLRAWYRAAVQYLDAEFAAFTNWLENTGRLDDSLVIVTSDHGEHLGEHGRLAHGTSWYDACLHIPLLIGGAGIQPGRRRDFVSLIDLFDTVCDAADITPPSDTDGESLLSETGRECICSEYGPREIAEDGAYADHLTGDQLAEMGRGKKSLITPDHTFVMSSDGTEQLYSRPDGALIEEPDAELLAEYREAMDARISTEFGAGDENGRTMTDAVRQNLEELGYL